MMDLDDFIKSTITQIVAGVRAASEGVEGIDASAFVNPRKTNLNHSDPVEIKFDVAVTVTGRGEGSAGAKVKVWGVFEAGGTAQQGQEHETVSRISFMVPVALPSTSAEHRKPRPTPNARRGRANALANL